MSSAAAMGSGYASFLAQAAKIKEQQANPKKNYGAPLAKDEGAESAYASGGDQGLADYYLNDYNTNLENSKYNSRGIVNGAKAVKEGKTTFEAIAKENLQKFNANKKQTAVSHPGYDAGPLKDPFGFTLNNPNSQTISSSPAPEYNATNPFASKPKTAAAPKAASSTESSNSSNYQSESSTPKYSWQRGKEKAQAWQAENDKVNEWKKSYNQNSNDSQKSYSQKFDFSAKNFTGS